MRFGVIRLQGDGAIGGRERLVVALERMQSRAAIALRIGMSGLQRQRTVVACQGLVETPQCQKRVAAIVQRRGIIGVSFQRAIDLSNRRGRIAALKKNNAEVVQAVELIGLNVEHLFVDIFRLGQSAGLMQGDGVRQQHRRTRQFRPMPLTQSLPLIAKSDFRIFLHASAAVNLPKTTSARADEIVRASL
ncbi:MAG TPA: hypothetical protein VL048_17605 [Xanthobacteraceae bacterium]|nr:hypothetical protein [Xanthobacteraceae bacterium]